MQSTLTASIEIVFVGSVVFFAAQFVLGLVNRHRPQPQVQPEAPSFIPNPDGFTEASPEEVALVEAHRVFVSQYWAKRPTINVVPFHRSKSATVAEKVTTSDLAPLEAIEALKTNFADLNPFQLRKLCQQQGIKWRNAKGQNKHLSKAEMVAALRSA